MCGFLVVDSPFALTCEDFARLRRGTALLHHRGPDDEGFAAFPESGSPKDLKGEADGCFGRGAYQTAFGFRRLSILDLSPAGHQPMHDAETGLSIVFNGEIYNYVELRERLIAAGARFRSGSDTEVLLKAFGVWGLSCLQELNGMFAFVIWNAKTRQLFLARDRFGEKQIYFRRLANGQLWICSEIKPLARLGPSREAAPDHLVWDFLMFGLADHTEETFFPEVRQLLPGTYIETDNSGRVEAKRYYDCAPRAQDEVTHDYAPKLRALLEDSVRLRLRSDVPVGSFLSGGMDSSSIVALANANLAERNGQCSGVLRTYTNAYAEGHPFDETPRVNAALRRFSKVQGRFFRTSEDDQQLDLPTLVAAQEQPFHTCSIYASFDLLRRIRSEEGIKVILSGEGADELLGGYIRIHLPVHMRDLLYRRQIRSWASEMSGWGVGRGLTATLKGLIPALPRALRLAMHRRLRPSASLLRADFFRAYQNREQRWVEEWIGLPLARRLAAEVSRFNLPQLLRHLDRNAMRSSIETRLPFTDHRLVEFALSLPNSARMRNGVSKYVLRQAMASSLPDEIVSNPTKLGFGMAEQYRFGDQSLTQDSVEHLRPYLDIEAFRRCLGDPGRAATTWLPVSLALWRTICAPWATESL